jgi:2-keto-4-pentenoate hydratase/2-oxohepta-3-ene-1,7-dioic acid hydratase in catechol pathway
MRFARFGDPGREKPCLVDSAGNRYDCSAHISDWTGDVLAGDLFVRLSSIDPASLPPVPRDARWGSPVPRPGKILCIGLNYADHAAESGMPIPEEPIVFMKAPNCVIGPYDTVRIPRGSVKTDWEVELAIVIGRETRYLESPSQAAAHIAGYCICNDISERHFQLERGGQWDKGKCCDTFCPLGPWVATADELGDVGNLEMRLSVNERERQHGSTATMVFDCATIVHYLSQFMTLEPGDVITTGTPPGVGLGQNPPVFLRAGDVMTLGIEGLGTQRQECAQDS